MKVKMLQTRFGTEDGFNAKLFKSGEEYEMREWLGIDFLQQDYAVLVSW